MKKLLIFWLSFIFTGQALAIGLGRALTHPWYVAEDVSSTADREEIPTSLTWRPWKTTQGVPFAFNHTVWLKTQLPSTLTSQDELYLPNWLEDLDIFIAGKLRYRFGHMDSSWHEVSSQTWHRIPLEAEDQGQSLIIRTHYAVPYLIKNATPSLVSRPEIESFVILSSLLLTFLTTVFLVFSVTAAVIALIRKNADRFFYFSGITFFLAVWMLSNQDSPLKIYIPIPYRLWTYIDSLSLFAAYACFYELIRRLFGAKSTLDKFNSRLILWVTGSVYGLALLPGAIHPWYLIPLLHLVFAVTIGPLFVSIGKSFKQGARRSLILSAGSVIFLLCIVHDLAHYFASFPTVVWMLTPLGFFVFVLSIVAILLQSYRDEIRETAENQRRLALETRVGERAQMIETKLRFQLAGTVAHRLNNPLQVAQMSLENLHRSSLALHNLLSSLFGEESEAQNEQLVVIRALRELFDHLTQDMAMIQSSVSRSAQCVVEMRAISAVDGQRQETVSWASLLQSVREKLREICEPALMQKLHVEVDTPNEVFVVGDRHVLGMALELLTKTCLEQSQEQLVISSWSQEPGVISIELHGSWSWQEEEQLALHRCLQNIARTCGTLISVSFGSKVVNCRLEGLSNSIGLRSGEVNAK